MTLATDTEKEPLIETNPSLQGYYAALESRIGYRLFLGGTRHFGYYQPGTKWPFPINGALRKMEDHLFDSLGLQPHAKVLDAGCGVAHVAMHLARKGLSVLGIDVISNHLTWARQEIRANGLEKDVAVRLMDYQHLDGLADASFDGVYTMETLVHAMYPEQALAEFFRVMKPGGSLALYEYDHPDFFSKDIPEDLRNSMIQVNTRASMPANVVFVQGELQLMLERQGFQDVVVQDLTENIKPMARLFFLVGYIPYLIICFLGLQAWFVNTQAGVQGYRVLRRRLWRYVAVTARKPGDETHGNGSVRERRIGTAGRASSP
ncbi:2-heptaprenyl-1,4-naphthoquinone methyltransferase [Usnea florida]